MKTATISVRSHATPSMFTQAEVERWIVGLSLFVAAFSGCFIGLSFSIS